MTTNSRLHRILRPAQIALLLACGALVASCCHTLPEESAFDQGKLDSANGIVNAGGVWTPERAEAFRLAYTRLPGSKRAAVLAALAGAINSKKIKVPYGQSILLPRGTPGSSCPTGCPKMPKQNPPLPLK